jgi:hypothetical protein
MSIRHVVKTLAACSAASVLGVALVLVVGAGPAGAQAVLVNGPTSLSTNGPDSNGNPVTPGTPYTSGQTITVTVTANSTTDNANYVANQVPGQTAGLPTGDYYLEECIDPGGTTANLPTTASECEGATDDFTQPKTNDGSFTDPSFTVYDLPDPNIGSGATMPASNKCDVAPNYCVIGIFAENPQAEHGFNYPVLFSAPFQITVGDGLDQGDDPGDGTPEVPLAIGLPLLALAAFGGVTIRNRRRHRRQEQEPVA